MSELVSLFQTGIKTFETSILFLRLGSRLSKCQSLFRDWDQDSKMEGYHCDRDSREDPTLISGILLPGFPPTIFVEEATVALGNSHPAYQLSCQFAPQYGALSPG